MLKSKEVVFQNSRRRTAVTPPQPLPDISRENELKILGVTITSHLSASEHIRRVISDSAQSLYALRVLRHHGMNEIGLHAVFRAVIVSRLTYASPAWSGLITATDHQRVEAFLRRSKRCGFCPHCRTSISCYRRQTIDCSREYCKTCTTHCISYFHHNLQYQRTITSDVASMTDNCTNTKGT